jgi:hypothetical protein
MYIIFILTDVIVKIVIVVVINRLNDNNGDNNNNKEVSYIMIVFIIIQYCGFGIILYVTYATYLCYNHKYLIKSYKPKSINKSKLSSK